MTGPKTTDFIGQFIITIIINVIVVVS